MTSSPTFHTGPLPCWPCTRHRFQSSGRTRQRVHDTGRDGSWGNPSGLPCSHRSASQTLLRDTCTGRCACHTVGWWILPGCSRRLDRQTDRRERKREKERRGQGSETGKTRFSKEHMMKEQVCHLYSLMVPSHRFPVHTGHSCAQSRWLCRDTGPHARRTRSCWTLEDRTYKLEERADVKPPSFQSQR